MKDYLINTYAFNLQYAEQLIADIEELQMTKSPGQGLENHPAFTIGHLASGAALTSKYLGGSYNFDPKWEQIFKRQGPGDPRMPEENIGLYPKKELLLNELTKQHQLVEALILELDETRFAAPVKWRFDKYMPTLGDLLIFMCITHEAMHLGQLAAWRRAMEMPSALAQL